MTAERGIKTGGHIILGLPGETDDEIIKQAPVISGLPLTTLKIHQMQVIRGTKLEKEYHNNTIKTYSAQDYIELIARYIQYLREDLVLERFVSQSPSELLVAPQWGLKNYEFTNLLNNYLKKHDIRQGQKVGLSF